MHVVGTAEYMAPEQAASRPVGPEADCYSLGIVLFEALTGQLPFVGPPVKVMMEKQRADPPVPGAVAAAVPADLGGLCTALLRFDPASRPTAATILEHLGQAGTTAFPPPSKSSTRGAPFVGRERHLAALKEAFTDSRTAGPVTVLVEGAAGVGKTALVRRFGEDLSALAADVVVLAGRCHEREAVPFKAVDGVVDALTRHLLHLPPLEVAALLPRAAALLAQVFPVMRRVKAIMSAPVLATSRPDPQELRTRLFAAVRDMLGRLADWHPLVVIIDDAHWADQDSLALLAELVRPPEAPTLLLVATLREGADFGWAGAAGTERFPPAAARRVHLGRLTRAEAMAAATQLLGRGPPNAAADPAVIAAESDGHPLFIDELVRVAATAARGATGVLRLEDALRSRIATLPAEARRVLELVAVAGTPIEQDTLGRAASLPPQELARGIGTLRVGNLVQTMAQRGRGCVAPSHDRVRDTVLAALDREGRREHHQALAAALEGAGQADSQLLGVHWRDAGDANRAAAYFLRAADEADAALAFDRAVGLYRAALDARPLEGAALREVQVKLGQALVNAGRGADAGRVFLAAAAGAPAAEALDLRRRAADNFLRCGHIDEGLETIREVLAAMGITLPRTARRALASMLLRRALVSLRGLRFRERDASQVAAEQLSRIDVCFSVAATLGTADTIRGTDFNARVLLMALRAGEPIRLARALAAEATFVAFGGVSACRRAARLARRAQELAEGVAPQDVQAYVSFAHGATEYYRGRFAAALAHFEHGERVLREGCGWAVWELDTTLTFVLFCLAYLGRTADLWRRVSQLAHEAVDRGDRYLSTILRLSFPSIAWLLGDDVAAARRMVNEALDGWSPRASTVYHWYGLGAQMQLELYEGDGVAAHARIRSAWRVLERSLILRLEICRIEALHLRARAAVAVAAAEPSRREAALREATRDAQRILRIRSGWADPLAHGVLAGVAALRGRLEEAAVRLDQATRGFEAGDLALHAAVARRRRGQLLGGDEGQALVATADAWMGSQKIGNPARMSALLVPGFPD
jgi:tetratricopeptide (TPR) repeat protein